MAIVSTSAFELLSRWVHFVFFVMTFRWLTFCSGGDTVSDESHHAFAFQGWWARIWLWCLPSSSLRRVQSELQGKDPSCIQDIIASKTYQSDVLKRGTTDDLGKVGAFFSQSWTWFSFRLPNLITVQKCFPNLNSRHSTVLIELTPVELGT